MELLLIFTGFIFLFIYINNSFKKFEKGSESEKVLMEWVKSTKDSLEHELSENRKSLTEHISSQNKAIQEQSRVMGERLDNAAKVVSDVHKELGKVGEFSKGIKELQDMLLSPKARGNVGEEILESLLAQILPPESYEMQYMFRSGEKVDAVIKTEKGIIPIDSKFPMENFRAMLASNESADRDSYKKTFIKDVKKHIDDISKKYILPSEGTIDFALMYIPSESVYYEAVVNSSELESVAREKRVMFVSPNSFYYLLKVILIGLQQKKFAEDAQKIWEAIKTLKKETDKFGGDLSVLDGHLNRARGSMDSVLTRYTGFSQKVETLGTAEKPLELPES